MLQCLSMTQFIFWVVCFNSIKTAELIGPKESSLSRCKSTNKNRNFMLNLIIFFLSNFSDPKFVSSFHAKIYDNFALLLLKVNQRPSRCDTSKSIPVLKMMQLCIAVHLTWSLIFFENFTLTSTEEKL